MRLIVYVSAVTSQWDKTVVSLVLWANMAPLRLASVMSGRDALLVIRVIVPPALELLGLMRLHAQFVRRDTTAPACQVLVAARLARRTHMYPQREMKTRALRAAPATLMSVVVTLPVV